MSMEIIRAKEFDAIITYELNIDKDSLVELQREELERVVDYVTRLQIMSSWKNKEVFIEFINKDIHDSYDFYFNVNTQRNQENEYIRINEIFESKKNNNFDFVLPFDHSFEVINNLHENEEIHDEEYISDNKDGESHYAILNINDVVYGGKHSSVGYHNDSIIQIPKIVYIIDKLLKYRLSPITKELKKSDYSFLLYLMNAEQIAIQKLSDISLQFSDKTLYDNHVNKMTETEEVVLALKNANRIKY